MSVLRWTFHIRDTWFSTDGPESTALPLINNANFLIMVQVAPKEVTEIRNLRLEA